MRIIRVVAAVIGSDNKIFDTAQEDIVNLKVNGNSQVERLNREKHHKKLLLVKLKKIWIQI